MFLMKTSKQAYDKNHHIFLEKAQKNDDESIPTLEFPFSFNDVKYIATIMIGEEYEYYILYVRYLNQENKWVRIGNKDFENHTINFLWRIVMYSEKSENEIKG